jgi:hypothetical protein
MKRIPILIISVLLSSSLLAQLNNNDDFANKNRWYLGGALGFGIGGYSGGVTIGVNPEIGYSLTPWLDGGLVFNVNYYTYSAEYNYGVRQRSLNLGTGVYMRIYPFNGFFLQAQPEYNWTTHNLLNYNYSPAFASEYKQNAASFLAGIGYGTRIVGEMNFYTVLMIDLGSEINSPYRDSYGNQIPIFRSGFNFYLGRKKR